ALNIVAWGDQLLAISSNSVSYITRDSADRMSLRGYQNLQSTINAKSVRWANNALLIPGNPAYRLELTSAFSETTLAYDSHDVFGEVRGLSLVNGHAVLAGDYRGAQSITLKSSGWSGSTLFNRT